MIAMHSNLLSLNALEGRQCRGERACEAAVGVEHGNKHSLYLMVSSATAVQGLCVYVSQFHMQRGALDPSLRT
jgi:hypothetical protein